MYCAMVSTEQQANPWVPPLPNAPTCDSASRRQHHSMELLWQGEAPPLLLCHCCRHGPSTSANTSSCCCCCSSHGRVQGPTASGTQAGYALERIQHAGVLQGAHGACCGHCAGLQDTRLCCRQGLIWGCCGPLCLALLGSSSRSSCCWANDEQAGRT